MDRLSGFQSGMNGVGENALLPIRRYDPEAEPLTGNVNDWPTHFGCIHDVVLAGKHPSSIVLLGKFSGEGISCLRAA
jgi:hypothetical protein